MPVLFRLVLISFVTLLACPPSAQAFKAFAEEPAPAITEKALLEHIEEITAWQRDVLSIETMPDNSLEKLLKDTLKQNSIKVVQFGFEYARAQAPLIAEPFGPTQELADKEEDDAKNTTQTKIVQTTRELKNRTAEVQKELGTINAAIRRAAARNRNGLMIKREQLNGELKLLTARQDLLASATEFFKDKDTKNGGTTLEKVDNLAMTLPVLTIKKKNGDTAASTTTPKATTITEQPKEQENLSRGLAGTSSDLLAVYRKKQEINELLTETSQLRTSNQKMVDSLRGTLQNTVRQGNELTQSLNSASSEAIANQNERIDAMVVNFKQLGTAVLPLGQVNIWLDASKRDLKEWRNSLDQQINKMTRRLMFQIALLGVAILIPIIISEATRRAIRKYVHDGKRQRQLNIVRRVVFALVIFLIILFNFVSEFSSIATYAGLLTAGLAVALQNVLLSIFAHFFYFGRFGVRIGDRVTIGKTTGEVIQVGLVRLYLMELAGPDYELYPTGKIVAFPNSVLFQPTSFAKQVPGTQYSWQEITFILDPSTDYRLASKKLNEAVALVYTQYNEIMEQQKTALTRATHLDVKMPVPKGFLNFINDGLALIIRYPIESSHAAEINQRITKRLLDAIANEPSLKLANSNPPTITAVPLAANTDDPSGISAEETKV